MDSINEVTSAKYRFTKLVLFIGVFQIRFAEITGLFTGPFIILVFALIKNNEHFDSRSGDDIDDFNFVLIGFTDPELFPARIKNAKNCNSFGEAFPQVLFFKVLSATATKQLTFKQIVSLENQFICVK